MMNNAEKLDLQSLRERGCPYKGSVFFATCAYDSNVCVEYVNSMVCSAMVLTQSKVIMEHNILCGDYDVGHARQWLAEAFLASDCTDLIFVDADVGFDAKVLPRILMYEELVVGGLVPKRDRFKDDVYHLNALTGVIQNRLFQSLECPTAFMRIKREAFAKLKKPYFKLNSTEMEVGEDIYFCRKLCAAGEFVWIDSDITFTHRGTKGWEGNFYDYCIREKLLTKNEGYEEERQMMHKSNGHAEPLRL